MSIDVTDAAHVRSIYVPQLTIHGFSMIRNEADIMELFIRQAAELFDNFTFIDVLSTDGTREMLANAALEHSNVTVLNCTTKEKYQAAMMNALAREALRAGVDWMFFLDADEFLPFENRHELELYLHSFGGEVMSMPWINLVPSYYSNFCSFNPEQTFYWSGRVSNFCKIAVSSLYFHNHPDAVIAEGNHTISPSRDAAPAKQILGIPLLHVPVRSRQRLKYKMTNGLRFLRSKHNSQAGEGSHVSSILTLIDDVDTSAGTLNAIAADYGQNGTSIEAVDPAEAAWPKRNLPTYLRIKSPSCVDSARSIGATLAADAQVKWREPDFVRNAPVGVAMDNEELRIIAQPISGRMKPRYERFAALPPVNPAVVQKFDSNSMPQLLSITLATTLLPIKFAAFSAWSRLIPVLFGIFAIARPRRFVELGVHNGMSFFAGCQVAEHLHTDTECVAVDSWVGDPHASFHDSSVFEEFKKNLSRDYPNAWLIQGMFSHARDCFDDGSIDLLHIDGYHTYEAVKEDFDTWLLKMSDTGIIIFHDINVHERNFGAWQFWRELGERYLALSFMHSHGLGVLYVGRSENAIAAIFRWLIDNPAYFAAAQKYFEILGENAMDHKAKTDEVRQSQESLRGKAPKVGGPKQLTAHVAPCDETAHGLHGAQWDGGERSAIPFNPDLGTRDEHQIVIAKALKLLTRWIRVKRVVLWPFKSSRERYRKQSAIANSPFNSDLGGRDERQIVIAKALKLLTRWIKVKSVFLWPFGPKHERYRKQIRIARFIRPSLAVPTDD